MWFALLPAHVAPTGSGVRVHLCVPCWESCCGAGWGVQGPVTAGRRSQPVVPPSLLGAEAAFLAHSRADIAEVHPELRGR